MCGRDSRTKEWKVEKAKSDGARCTMQTTSQKQATSLIYMRAQQNRNWDSCRDENKATADCERQTHRWNHQGDVRREQTKSDMHAVHSGSPHDDRTFAWWAINILVHMQEVETFMGINTPWTILILWDNLWPSFWGKFIRSILLNLAAAYQMLHHKLHVTLSVVRIPSSLQWHFWFQKWPWYQCRKRSNTWNYLNGHVHVRIL